MHIVGVMMVTPRPNMDLHGLDCYPRPNLFLNTYALWAGCVKAHIVENGLGVDARTHMNIYGVVVTSRPIWCVLGVVPNTLFGVQLVGVVSKTHMNLYGWVGCANIHMNVYGVVVVPRPM